MHLHQVDTSKNYDKYTADGGQIEHGKRVRQFSSRLCFPKEGDVIVASKDK